MKKILFITTNNLSTNPRLVKELHLISKESCEINVIIFKLGNWSDLKSEQIIAEISKSAKVTFISLAATKQTFLPWLFWAILEKIARQLYPLFKHSLFINSLANSRRSVQILKRCERKQLKPDLIWAHNLGALYPTWRLSKMWAIPFIFDVEDYHPGELIRFDAINEKKRREYLMKKLLPHAVAITSASPLIDEYTMDLIGQHPQHQIVVNSFPVDEFIEPKKLNPAEPLKLVWFSQKISYGRGLEQLFDALCHLSNQRSLVNNWHLTLIGSLDEVFENEIFSPTLSIFGPDRVCIKPPMTQQELHKSLASFDVGLALEFNCTDLNRELCLTNKIFAYAQSGLFILATDTLAQKQFMDQYPKSGSLSGQTSQELLALLKKLIQQKKVIRDQRKERYLKNRHMAWEYEGEKVIQLVEKVLSTSDAI